MLVGMSDREEAVPVGSVELAGLADRDH